MEYLSLSVQKAMEDHNWYPLYLAKEGPSLSHTLFADNIMLYREADDTRISTMKQVYEISVIASGNWSTYKNKKCYSHEISPIPEPMLFKITFKFP